MGEKTKTNRITVANNRFEFTCQCGEGGEYLDTTFILTMGEKTKTNRITVANNRFEFICQCDEGGEYLDTTVTLNGSYFCCISWKDREQFITDFTEFMAKHRI
jgi:hypothetical protein